MQYSFQKWTPSRELNLSNTQLFHLLTEGNNGLYVHYTIMSIKWNNNNGHNGLMDVETINCYVTGLCLLLFLLLLSLSYYFYNCWCQ